MWVSSLSVSYTHLDVYKRQPFYSVEDLFPYGHGEKSVFLIERFMKLKVEEAVAPAELTAGMKDRKDHFDRRKSRFFLDIDRNSPSVIDNGDGIEMCIRDRCGTVRLCGISSHF